MKRLLAALSIFFLPFPLADRVHAQTPMESKTFELVNQDRQTKGLAALVWNDAIANAARRHSVDMAAGTVPFGHDGLSDRINGLGASMSISAAGENVGTESGGADPAAIVVQAWLNSAGHLANIENAANSATGIGIAVSSGGSYLFTQIFVSVAR
jgi:uncharacterized protein YkwD